MNATTTQASSTVSTAETFANLDEPLAGKPRRKHGSPIWLILVTFGFLVVFMAASIAGGFFWFRNSGGETPGGVEAKNALLNAKPLQAPAGKQAGDNGHQPFRGELTEWIGNPAKFKGRIFKSTFDVTDVKERKETALDSTISTTISKRNYVSEVADHAVFKTTDPPFGLCVVHCNFWYESYSSKTLHTVSDCQIRFPLETDAATAGKLKGAFGKGDLVLTVWYRVNEVTPHVAKNEQDATLYINTDVLKFEFNSRPR